MNTHTPGPWRFEKKYAHGAGSIVAADGKGVACVSGSIMRPENEVNARLIAKAPIAPKLAEALRDAHAKLANILRDPVARKAIGGMFAGTQRAEEVARAALAEWDNAK